MNGDREKLPESILEEYGDTVHEVMFMGAPITQYDRESLLVIVSILAERNNVSSKLETRARDFMRAMVDA